MPSRVSGRVYAVLVSAALVCGVAAVTTASSATASVAPDPIAAAIAASSAPGSTWSPGPERYGVTTVTDVPVTMADGTVLRANIDYPSDLTTGAIAAGRFPALLTMSPYGKEAGSYAAAVGPDPYLVKRGYIDIVVDVRGTGASGGTFDLFDPAQVADGVTLVTWAAGLAHANGKVGLHGASYLGINQLLTAGAVGTNSPLKAIFPIVSATDPYRETAFMGGIPDGSFDLAYLGALLPVLGVLNPVFSALIDPSTLLGLPALLLARLQNAGDYNVNFIADAMQGGPNSYDTAYWDAKAPVNVLKNVVANHIPAYLIGGEYDIFQRGEPLNFAGLQNAWAARPVTAPMLAGQKVTGRYQLLDGPFTHLGGAGTSLSDLEPLELEWFDTWLKGASTGMDRTPTPLHYYDLGTSDYAETTTYPLTGSTPTTYYFDGTTSGSAPSLNDGTLTTRKPTAASGSDTVAWAPVSTTVCDRPQDQWTMGALSLITNNVATAVPCLDDDRPAQVGPTALTYTTAPMASAKTIAGPISTTVYAGANTTDTEWVVNVEDVAPDGTSKPLTEGALLGSMRAVDAARTWKVGGKVVMPYHDYTEASAVPVTPGQVTQYQIEVFPTYSTIAAGHRLRVALSTTDAPHLVPTLPQQQELFGGVYEVQRTAAAPSSLTVLLVNR